MPKRAGQIDRHRRRDKRAQVCAGGAGSCGLAQHSMFNGWRRGKHAAHRRHRAAASCHALNGVFDYGLSDSGVRLACSLLGDNPPREVATRASPAQAIAFIAT